MVLIDSLPCYCGSNAKGAHMRLGVSCIASMFTTPTCNKQNNLAGSHKFFL